MELQIRNLNIGTYDAITEALGEWAQDNGVFYSDGLEVCDVDVDVERVTLESANDGIWLKKGDSVFKLEREDFSEITIF